MLGRGRLRFLLLMRWPNTGRRGVVDAAAIRSGQAAPLHAADRPYSPSWQATSRMSELELSCYTRAELVSALNALSEEERAAVTE